MHDHHHHHHTPQHGKAFAIGIGLNVLFVIVEVFYGMQSDSSALLADAGHNLSDVMSLVLAAVAIKLTRKKPDTKYTYGWRKTTILASLFNAILLFIAVFFIGKEAFEKIMSPENDIAGKTVMIVSGIGLLINGATAMLFMKNSHDDINIKGAFLHMAADAAVSLGVLIGGAFILWFDWYWIDPVLSFIIMIVIIWGTWKLFIQSLHMALDAVPSKINWQEVKDHMAAYDGIEDIHDLHIWPMSTTQIALTAHIVVPKGHDDQLIFQISKDLKTKFGIDHTTLQSEASKKGHHYCHSLDEHKESENHVHT